MRTTILALLLAAHVAVLHAQPPDAGRLLGPEGIARIQARFEGTPALAEVDGRPSLQSGKGTVFAIAGAAADDAALVLVGDVVVEIPSDTVQERASTALDLLPALVAAAKKAGLADQRLRLREVLLVGPHLSTGTAWILPEGVASKRLSGTKPSRDPVTEQLKALVKEIEGGSFTELVKTALVAVIRMLDQDSSDDENVTPGFARRIVRHHYLTGFLKDHAALATSLTQAVIQADRLVPVTLYEGEGIRIAELQNAFGDGGWTLMTPARAGYAVELPPPNWHPDPPSLSLVVDLPPGSNPAIDAARFIRATVHDGDSPIATFAPDSGFTADAEVWGRATRRALGETADIVPGFFPPHVLVRDLNGDLSCLATRAGVVHAPQNGTDEDVARFLAEAKVALPGAAHLDLLGEYFFFYCMDSPDTRIPELVGTDDAQGELHQTVAQTLSTAAGGVCRGDCDDLAELFHAILDAQGRLGHIMNLPAHNALGWASRDPEDGSWGVDVLQTGPPLHFKAATLPKALEKAYQAFGVLEAFDPDQVSIAVRFSGDNTRSSWVLGWRIFQDRAYAETMIDVQRDWHFHTYRRGIGKMERLIAEGDGDPANHRELIGLGESTGQYKAAAEAAKTAIEKGGDPTLSVAIRRITDLYLAEDKEAARALARETIELSIPKIKEKLGPAFPGVVLALAGTIIGIGKDAALGGALLNEHVTFPIGRQIVSLAGAMSRPNFSKAAWTRDPTAQELRRLFVQYVGTAYLLIKEGGPTHLAEDVPMRHAATTCEQWLQLVALHDISEPGDLSQRYSDAGAYYRTILGSATLTALLDQASFPNEKIDDPTRRLTGLSQMMADLPWIKASVPFWVDELTRLFERERQSVDRAQVVALHGRVHAAIEASRKLDESAAIFEYQLQLVDLITAIVTEDEAALKGVLEGVAERGDKSLRDSTASWIGATARFVTPEWFEKTLALWHATVSYKPDYFLIAWSAVQNKAPEHGRRAAAFAARCFPDDPTFAEECAFLHALVSDR